MTIRKLTAEDYDELLSVLNIAFGRLYQREMDFTKELPNMWERDDEHMGRHFGAFEDGKMCAVVGVYPLLLRVNGISLNFATTGNVATLPEYEGRGYFAALFRAALEEVERCGYHAARLTGQRQRYGRRGYVPCGGLYRMVFTRENRIRCSDVAYEDIEFTQLSEQDTELLVFCRELAHSKPLYVQRSEDTRYVYRAMCGKTSTAYIATRGGQPIGYICAGDGGKKINEIRAYSADDFVKMVFAWQACIKRAISVPIAPYLPQEYAALWPYVQEVSLTTPSMFKIVHWEPVCNAFMKLAHSVSPLPQGKAVLGIEGYGTLEFYATEDDAGCRRADGAPCEQTLSPAQAAALIFGPFRATMLQPQQGILNAWFPLPLSWDVLDYV